MCSWELLILRKLNTMKENCFIYLSSAFFTALSRNFQNCACDHYLWLTSTGHLRAWFWSQSVFKLTVPARINNLVRWEQLPVIFKSHHTLDKTFSECNSSFEVGKVNSVTWHIVVLRHLTSFLILFYNSIIKIIHF